MSMSGGFYISAHQGKERRFAAALEAAGYTRCVSGGAPDIRMALFDHDIGPGGSGWRMGLEELHARGVGIFLFPHGARPMLQWDMGFPCFPHTRCNLVIGQGHAEVMRAYGYPIRTEVVGWPYCEQRPFTPKEPNGKVKVLFAPTHPNGNGFLHETDRRWNREALSKLLQTPGIELTVRHIKRIDLSGLWKAPGARYVLGRTDGSVDDIDRADVVVAHQTYAWLAAARGKPLIMHGDLSTPHSGGRHESMVWAQHYEAYRELMRYPLEAESANDGRQMREMIEHAMSEDVGAQWRQRFIGEAMDGKKVVEIIEKYLEES